jgi:hypothetical protein
VILLIVPKASYDIMPWATAAEESQNNKSHAAFETIFRIRTVFKEASAELYNYFSLSSGNLEI